MIKFPSQINDFLLDAICSNNGILTLQIFSIDEISLTDKSMIFKIGNEIWEISLRIEHFSFRSDINHSVPIQIALAFHSEICEEYSEIFKSIHR